MIYGFPFAATSQRNYGSILELVEDIFGHDGLVAWDRDVADNIPESLFPIEQLNVFGSRPGWRFGGIHVRPAISELMHRKVWRADYEVGGIYRSAIGEWKLHEIDPGLIRWVRPRE